MKTKTIVLVLGMVLLAACGGSVATTMDRAEPNEAGADAAADVGADAEDASHDAADASRDVPDAAPDVREASPAPEAGSADVGADVAQDAPEDASSGPDVEDAGTTDAAATCDASWASVCYDDAGQPFCGPMGPPQCGYDCTIYQPQTVYWQQCPDGGTQVISTMPAQQCGSDHRPHCVLQPFCLESPPDGVGTLTCSNGDSYYCGAPSPAQCP